MEKKIGEQKRIVQKLYYNHYSYVIYFQYEWPYESHSLFKNCIDVR